VNLGTIVFTGPTLSAEAASAYLPDAIVLPPARQGDLWRAIRSHHPAVIALIDGVFLHEPSVWHREILWALSKGVHVFGGASMGALRASELARFGMRGVGRIFEAYRDGLWPGFIGPFEDDDEVAVIYTPVELGAVALSDALVDVRDTLLAAEAAGIIDYLARISLFEAMRSLPFPKRSFAKLLAAADAHLASDIATALRAWLPNGVVARKRLDAQQLLEDVAAFLNTRASSPFITEFHFENVQTWHDFTEDMAVALTPEETLVLEELRLKPLDWRNAARAALGRVHARFLTSAQPDIAIRRAFDTLRLNQGLIRQVDIDVWQADNALSADGFVRLLHDEAAIAATLKEPPPLLATALVDQLRLTGQFVDLLQRAHAKLATLADSPSRPSGPMLDAALSWWAELHGEDDLGPAREFQTSIWREYVFVHRGLT
jgi:hypothetical protein